MMGINVGNCWELNCTSSKQIDIFVLPFEQMIKKYLILFLLLPFAASVFAQEKTIREEDKDLLSEDSDTEILLKQEASGGLVLHSNGWGFIFRRGTHATAKKKRMWEIEAVSMKHPKEFKSVNPYFENAKGYIYGKQNSLLVLRGGYGHQRVIYHKEDRRNGGVEVRYHYYGGASLGLTKPVYLEILIPTNVPFEFTLTTEKYNPDEHYIDNIYGKAPFAKGLNEIKVNPGVYLKSGFSFEYASRQDNIRTIEAGVVVDGYYKKIPIMALTENKQVFLSFYVNIQFGAKWY